MTGNKKYDLEERTAIFAEGIIMLCKKIPKGPHTNRIIDQLTGSGTGTGADYHEANGAASKRDFRNKILNCLRESKESQYWLRMLIKAVPELEEECKLLWKEAKELTLIFSTIAKKSR